MVSLQEWLIFLKGSHGVAGFPLVIAGLGLMLLGWRLWKLCVMLSFAAIFAGVGAWLVGPGDDQWVYALAIGAVGGALSYWPVNMAVALLGGLVGAGVISSSLASLGLSGITLWACAAVALGRLHRLRDHQPPARRHFHDVLFGGGPAALRANGVDDVAALVLRHDSIAGERQRPGTPLHHPGSHRR